MTTTATTTSLDFATECARLIAMKNRITDKDTRQNVEDTISSAIRLNARGQDLNALATLERAETVIWCCTLAA